VIFTTARGDVTKAKQLQVSRSLYLECAMLRQKVCYAFADVHISEKAAEELLPENGVPEIFVREAVHMQEAKFFEPAMDGPAKMRDPTAKEQDPGSAEEEEEEKTCDEKEHDAFGSATSAVPAEDALPESVVAEQLIGLDEANLDDPLSQVIILQSRLKALQEEGDKLVQRQSRRAANPDQNFEDVVAINAGSEQCRQHFVEVQSVIKKMTRNQTDPMTAIDKQDTAERLKNRIFRHDPASIGNENRNRAAVLDAMDLAAQRSRGGTTDLPNTGGNEPTSSSAGPSAKPQALNIEAGKALSMFESLSWVYSLVEFFYGDCVPRHPKREKKTIYNP
jgi:hypothetical protein